MRPPEPQQDERFPLRMSARVLVFDPAGRVLLFRGEAEPGRPFWYPPGGGGEPGETPEQTARRELCEETGLCDAELIAEVGRRRGLRTFRGVTYDCYEPWFLARVSRSHVDTAGFTETERRSIDAYRWWTADELDAASEPLVLPQLPALVRALLRDGPPPQPLDLGE